MPDGKWLARIAERHVVFPGFAVLLVAIIVLTTGYLSHAEIAKAERAAVNSTRELLDTYEAQVLRNLREIDNTLKVVKYAYESSRNADVLSALKYGGLLPPNIVFTVTIADRDGNVLASTYPVKGRQQFEIPALGAATTALWMGRSRREEPSQDWKLDFARPLRDARGAIAGAVIVTVHAAYLVSGYERTRFGDQGLLAIVGTDDGIYRALRLGEVVSAGERAEPALQSRKSMDNPPVFRAASWRDGVARFTTAKPLFEFPLTLAVALAEDEQLTGARRAVYSYWMRAGLVSVLMLAFIWLLARFSRQLAQAARREIENAARLEQAERVQYLAYHDALTGLPNRAFFSKLLERGIWRARRDDRPLAVLFLDIDRFKQINDTLGHDVGDLLLKEIAARLKSSVRESDTVARLGGDEFVVILSDIAGESDAAGTSRKILAAVAQPLNFEGRALTVTTSIGIGLYPRDGQNEQALTKCADIAMYHAKNEGKNNFQFYAKKLQVDSEKRLTFENSLRRALEGGELTLHYQPQVATHNGRVMGAEALLRWQSPEHGLIAPQEFIPIAEETGLIVPIGRWALEAACRQGVLWQQLGVPKLRMAVNVSARQFADPDLFRDVEDILKETGFDPSRLELEITESVLMSNVERATDTLRRLAAIGVCIAVDDFGTGYSSLSNLKRFPVATLKIDRSFVTELNTDANNRAITETVIAMAKALRLNVIAEGVETPDQLRFLQERECDEYQGYYFSRALTAERLGELIVPDARGVCQVVPLRAPRATASDAV